MPNITLQFTQHFFLCSTIISQKSLLKLHKFSSKQFWKFFENFSKISSESSYNVFNIFLEFLLNFPKIFQNIKILLIIFRNLSKFYQHSHEEFSLKLCEILLKNLRYFLKNSAVCVRTRTVNVNTFSTTVKDEILEGW